MSPVRQRWTLLSLMALFCAAANRSEIAYAADVGTAKVYEVNISGFAFAPKTLSVPVGATVKWTNRDEEPHLVTSAGSLFTASKALDTNDSYSMTFTKPGIYAYYCSIHPMMVGTIIVQ